MCCDVFGFDVMNAMLNILMIEFLFLMMVMIVL